jgi:hypothetical protein
MTTGQPRHGGVHGGGAFRQLSMTLMALVVCGGSSSVDAEDGRSLDSLDAPRVDLSLVATRAAHTASSLPDGRSSSQVGALSTGAQLPRMRRSTSRTMAGQRRLDRICQLRVTITPLSFSLTIASR